MCLHPITITNNANHFNEKTMPLSYTVPCGQCEECMKARRTEWFVRAFYQWQECKANGGMTFFYTLTFDEQNVPKYHGIRCFDRDLIQRFAKRFKMRLLRKFGVKLTYIITSEYGELFQRPHHHALFYIDKPMNCVAFHNELEQAWTYGFIKAGDNFGIVQNSNGILYVVKYVTKDQTFKNKEQQLYNIMYSDWSRRYNEWRRDAKHTYPTTFNQLLAHRNQWCGNPEVAEWYRSFYREYHRRAPFNAHSTGFGACLATDKYMKDPHFMDVSRDVIRIPNGRDYQEVPLPRYLQRKFYYDLAEDDNGKPTRFVLNEKGKAHFIETLDARIEKRTQKMKEIFSARLTDWQLHELQKNSLLRFQTRHDYEYFLENLADVDFRRLAIYSLVYRNRYQMDEKEYDLWNDYKQYLADVFAEVEDITSRPLRSYTKTQIIKLHNNTYNWHEDCEPYEYLFDFYTRTKQLIDAEKNALHQEKETKVRALRDLAKMKLM